MVVAANAMVFYAIQQANELRLDGLPALLKQASSLLPIGFADLVATVLNTLPSADFKATLVYWRWRNALPGHRAFSRHASQDTRINLERLRKTFKGAFPEAPAEQNAAWYKLYKSVRNDVMVWTRTGCSCC